MNNQEIEQTILNNQKLVHFVVHKYFPHFFNDEDIAQVGLIGLWQACVHYDSSKGKFSTFAVRCIINEIRKELYNRAKLWQFGDMTSLDEPFRCDRGGEKEVTLAHLIADPRDDYCTIDYDISYLKSKLSKRDMEVFRLNIHGFTRAEIGRAFGFTRAWASARIKKAQSIARSEFGYHCT